MAFQDWITPGPGATASTPFERWLSGIKRHYNELNRLYNRVLEAKLEGDIDLTAAQKTALRTAGQTMMTELRALVASDPT